MIERIKRTLVAAVCLLGAVAAQAQIFYTVTAPDTGKVSYLLGSHHFGALALVDSIPGVADGLQACDKVYGEIDMAVMADPTAMMSMQQAMMAPADSTLDLLLAPAQLDSVAAAFSEVVGMPVPAQALTALKPSAVSMQMAQMLALKQAPQGFDAAKGIDATMQTRGRSLGKEVGGLETLAHQIDVLFNTPLARQAAKLMETVRDMDKERKMNDDLLAAYNAMDIDRIGALMAESMGDSEDGDALLKDRNEAWLKTLTAEMPAHSLFVVVGAGHLPGPDGLLAGLRKAGFTIK